MGKAVGKDRAKGKATYPALFGVEDSRRKAEELVREAVTHLILSTGGPTLCGKSPDIILQRKN